MTGEQISRLDSLFSMLEQNWDLAQEIEAFSVYLKNPCWILLREVPDNLTALKKTELGDCARKKKASQSQMRAGFSKVLTSMKKAKKTGLFEKFEYNGKMHGLCYPLKANGETFGFIILCELKKPMGRELQNIFTSFTDAVIRESQKELELEEMNNTIRPRAIALSTVHTVHRLMTSTLDINELLPRIARLTLQVIRANRCSIKLVDVKGTTLIPKATIDLRKAKTKLKKVEIGKYAPGKAVKRETPIRGDKYIASPLIDEEVLGVITVYDKIDGTYFTKFDEEIMMTLSEQAAIAIKNAQLFKEQADLTLSSIKCIARLLENRPHGSHRAEASFMKLINIMGPKFNMNESEIKMLQYAAMLHDAGQISIPEKLLMKRGELTGKEFSIFKKHPMKGANILSKFRPLKPIVPIIMYHHENWNGSGYPKGLKKNGIPLTARILAVISAFEAMITEKPYRRALSINAAIKEVQKNSGTQFDPQVVKIFCEAASRKDVRRLLSTELGKR